MPRVRTLSLLALGAAVALVLDGCAADERPGTAASQPDRPAATAVTPSGASVSPTTTPSPSATRSPRRRPSGHKTGLLSPHPRATSFEDHLLAADRMPALADGATWTVRSTGSEDPAGAAAVGVCQKTGLGAIGAVAAVRRTFAADGLTATQVVARFADPRSAWRADRVLTAWHDDCAERLADLRARVGPITEVSLRVGSGGSYRLSHGRRTDGDGRRTSGLGVLRTGSHLTVVEVTAAPGGYPGGRDPARVVLRRVSRTFEAD